MANLTAGFIMPTSGPPYAPHTSGFGGRPDTKVDVGVSVVFAVLYGLLGMGHLFLHRRNKAVGHLFIFSFMIFAFCMSRVTTFIFRIEWAKHPASVNVAISANVFVSAGVIILFITNMNFCQRIVRAYHPRLYNNKPFYYAFLAYYVSLVVVLIIVITTMVLSFYTLNSSALKSYMDARKFCVMWFLIFAFASLPITLAAVFWPSSTGPQNFGKMGSLKTKVIIVLVSGAILTLSTAVRVASTLGPTRPANHPAWYSTRASFYVFLGVLEVSVVLLYGVMRVDQRFFIPEKAEAESETGPEKVPALAPDGDTYQA